LLLAAGRPTLRLALKKGLTEDAAIDINLTTFEGRKHKVIPRTAFAWRMAYAIGLWFAITTVGLAIGIAGYAGFEGMSLTDSFLNAAMILSGMGPLSVPQTWCGKLFAGCYALYSGLAVVLAVGLIIAPIVHRVMHRFHVNSEQDD
jgi:nitrate/nitrite transporter NarK